nr:integrase, catalytic region, zinc finger, CCHC-type, peptidase aspartic, catalytic [Tanacetum cinerariifolium]
MTRNLKLLINFVEKFLGTVKFGNDQIAPILGYGNLVQGAVTIKKVYYVEGLNRNLFSIGQFRDADLEVAFRKSTCYIRDLKGNDLLTGVDFRRWQKKMHFMLSSMSVVYVLTTPMTEDGGENPTVEQVRKRVKWDNDDYVCRCLILNGDAPNQRQQQHTTPLNIQTTTEPSCQVLTQALIVTTTENINQAETIAENAQVADDEFINFFYTPVHNRGETSSCHVDSSNMHTFYQRHPFEHRCTKDHPLEQVIKNPSQSVKTRRQLESDGEMCMFALTVSRTKPKNIKEAMVDSVWIESMQEELHQFDRLDDGVDLKESFTQVARLEDVRLFIGVGTPMATKHLDDDLSETPVDQTKYRSMVGALMYLTASRPDIMHATCYCARYQAKPTEKHLTAVNGSFGTLKTPLTWDSSGDNLVSWSSKKKDCTSISSAEAGLTQEGFKYLIRRLGMRCLTPEELKVLANESA